ncbi:MAG TPA: HD domain-containing protein [Dissulfurispiraceae bacterium]|nr:HD domain-containing protein [Dissulfurispiraceae bacterium]
MREHDLERMKAWFAGFCRNHTLPDPQEQRNLDMKEQHTFNVCENIRSIAASIRLSPEDILIAEAVALFHDVGRFPQFVHYRTFRDDQSENHALLSVKALEENRVLEKLHAQDQTLIAAAVRFHNAFALPDLPDARQILFLKLIRDADKLDILRVFIDAYEGKSNPSGIGLGLPETAGYSPEAIHCIAERKIFTLRQLRSLNDFRLLQLSWVFDLNFTESIRMMLSRNYPRRIASHLPQTDEILATVNFVVRYMEERIADG